MVSAVEYPGIDRSELLQLEAELCTPTKRQEWVNDTRYGSAPHEVRVALLRDVYKRCAPRGLKLNDLTPVLTATTPYARKLDGDRRARIYELFNAKRPMSVDDVSVWNTSRELLVAMLGGFANINTDEEDARNQVVKRIANFFFPQESARQIDLPPPFFQVQRTTSRYVGYPHDEAEANFFTVSLARRHYRKETRVRWFMASGRDVLHSLTGSDFNRWAERLTAAICFGLDFTFIVPQAGDNKGPIHNYLDRIANYWKNDLDITILQSRYPEFRGMTDRGQFEREAGAHLKIVAVPMIGSPRYVEASKVTQMFPLAHSFKASADMKGGTEVYGPAFLNPWLRFHWADLVDENRSSCEPQFAAIAYNDSARRNTLHLVEPESMFEYLKWLSAFIEPGAEVKPATPLQSRRKNVGQRRS